MNDPKPSREERLFEVLAHCIDQATSGETSLARLVQEHPEFADELRDYFDIRQDVESLASPFRVGHGDVGDRSPDPSHDTDAYFDGCETRRAEAATLPQFERYECTRLISRGGMGVVYEARDGRLGRVVALKMLRRSAHLPRPSK